MTNGPPVYTPGGPFTYAGGMSSEFWSSLADDALTGHTGSSTDPVGWVNANGEWAWSEQRRILESVRDNRYTAVHSAHDLGKSFIASRIIAWWIDSHPIGEAFVVSTAPSAAQVGAIMWREVAKIHKKAGLTGKINRAGYPQWYVDAELIGYGRKPADYEQSAFQGIHARYVLVVIDEAGGVPKHLYDSIDALVTNEHARVLAIGNPDDPASHFSSICKPGSGWHVIHLDGLRSPNMTYDRVVGPDPALPKWPLLAALMEAEGIPYSTEEVPDELREYLVDERWIEERIARWAGVSETQIAMLEPEAARDLLRQRTHGSSLFTAKVRGIFPEAASDGVIPLGWITQAVNRWKAMQDHPEYNGKPHSLKAVVPGARIVGVDVARTGNDMTCLAIRYGSYLAELHRMRVTDTMEVADRVAAYMHEPGASAVVDVIGIGSGVYDRLRRMKTDVQITGTAIAFNASAGTTRRDMLGQFHFFNSRAAAWWNMREILDPSKGSAIALPDDEEMIEELAAPKFDLYANGHLKVESKDDIKRRIGRSTDSADAVIQAFWIDGPGVGIEGIPYTDSGYRAGRNNRGQVISYDGYDPFTDVDMTVGLGDGNLAGYKVRGNGPGAYHPEDEW